MQYRLLIIILLLCASVSNSVAQSRSNLTELLNTFSKERNITISFSPTLTNGVYPKNSSLQGEIAVVLKRLLADSPLEYKQMNATTYYIFKSDKPVEKPAVAPKPKPQPQPQPVAETSKGPDLHWSVKTNALIDLTTTVNVGVELGLYEQWSVQLMAYVNPWKFGNNHFNLYMVQPEARYWFNNNLGGQFVGLHVNAGYFDLSRLSYTGNFLGKNFTPIKGGGIGVGVDYGYKWNLKQQWYIEAAVGLGYSAFFGAEQRVGHYVGVTKLACSISYTFK